MSGIHYLYDTCIKGTLKKAPIKLVSILLCRLNKQIRAVFNSNIIAVHINTRVIKHIYDKRPAEECYFCINNVRQTLKSPHQIYRNKSEKRGNYCFVKSIQGNRCFVSIEEGLNNENSQPVFEVATIFRTTETYLKSYELLWEWKGGESSS